jgi:hypothetical protein
MQVFQTKILIQQLKAICESNEKFVMEKVTPLNDSQLLWKPKSKSWSIVEIFAHLNEVSRYYQNAIEKKIQENSHLESVDVFISSPLGRATWKQVKLGKLRNIKRHLKSARVFNPDFFGLELEKSEFETFLRNMEQMKGILDAAKKVNLRKIKISMAVSKFIHLRLGDALLFHTYHVDRHMEQINQILRHPKFPKGA